MLKKIILVLVAVVLIVTGIFIYREYNRKNADLRSMKPSFTLEAGELIAAFEKDSASANRKYINKVVQTSGAVKTIDTNGNPVVIALGNPGEMSSVLCSMDSAYAAEYRNIREGETISIKGMCIGGETQDLFGTDVKLNRCVILLKK
jgi:hypothetical protein